MTYKLQWTERKNEEDYSTLFGIGPRFHPRFKNAEVVKEADGTITFQRIVLDSDTAADQAHHIQSWDGYFNVKIEKFKKDEKTKNGEKAEESN